MFVPRWVFLLGKFHKAKFNLESAKEKGRALASQCFLCCEEETIDHILVHCTKARILL